MDRRKYLRLFLDESREHLEGARTQVGNLRAGEAGKQASLEELYRHLHSLKGMCAAMEYHGLTEFLPARRRSWTGSIPWSTQFRIR